jgi:hypothetical protein
LRGASQRPIPERVKLLIPFQHVCLNKRITVA